MSFLLIPVVINSVTPLVNYGGRFRPSRRSTRPRWTSPRRTPTSSRWRRSTRPSSPRRSSSSLNSRRCRRNGGRGHGLPNCATPNPVPKAVLAKAVAAAGGGATGPAVLTSICQNAAAIHGVIEVSPAPAEDRAVRGAANGASEVPKPRIAYLNANATDLPKPRTSLGSGRPGTGSASAGSSSSSSASRCCAAGGRRPTPARTRRSTRRWSSASWPRSAPDRGPAVRRRRLARATHQRALARRVMWRSGPVMFTGD